MTKSPDRLSPTQTSILEGADAWFRCEAEKIQADYLATMQRLFKEGIKPVTEAEAAFAGVVTSSTLTAAATKTKTLVTEATCQAAAAAAAAATESDGEEESPPATPVAAAAAVAAAAPAAAIFPTATVTRVDTSAAIDLQTFTATITLPDGTRYKIEQELPKDTTAEDWTAIVAVYEAVLIENKALESKPKQLEISLNPTERTLNITHQAQIGETAIPSMSFKEFEMLATKQLFAFFEKSNPEALFPYYVELPPQSLPNPSRTVCHANTVFQMIMHTPLLRAAARQNVEFKGLIDLYKQGKLDLEDLVKVLYRGDLKQQDAAETLAKLFQKIACEDLNTMLVSPEKDVGEPALPLIPLIPKQGRTSLQQSLLEVLSGASFWSPPSTLMIQMQRNQGKKNTHPVSLEEQIIVPIFGAEEEESTCARYELTSFAVHTGEDVNSGHYTAYVKQKQGRETIYYEISDSVVKKITKEEFFEKGKLSSLAFYDCVTAARVPNARNPRLETPPVTVEAEEAPQPAATLPAAAAATPHPQPAAALAHEPRTPTRLPPPALRAAAAATLHPQPPALLAPAPRRFEAGLPAAAAAPLGDHRMAAFPAARNGNFYGFTSPFSMLRQTRRLGTASRE